MTALKTWILVISLYEDYNTPLIIDGHGQSKEIGLSYESNTYASCSIVWRGQMVVFGGENFERQISVLDGCQLTKKGELPFDLYTGACAQRDDAEIFLCFTDISDDSTYKNCHLSNSPFENFSKLPSSTYDHGLTRVAVTSGNAIINSA